MTLKTSSLLPVSLSSPVGFFGNNAPGFFPPTQIGSYGIVQAEGPAPAGFVGLNLNYRSAITCGNGYTNISRAECIAEGWEMHVGGTPVFNQGYGGEPETRLGDPGNLDYQQRWIEASATYLNAHGGEGVWVDDSIWKVYDFYNGTFGNVFPDEHPSESQYKTALLSFANTVKAWCDSNSWKSSYNTAVSADDDASLTAAWWSQIGPNTHYLSAEYWMTVHDVSANSDTCRRVGAEWYNNWNGWRALHGVCQSAGCGFLPIPSGGFGTGGGAGGPVQIYSLGSFMLDWDGSMEGGANLYALNDVYISESDPWSMFYANAIGLGAPRAAATNVGNVWTRQFQHGSLQVNADNATATITF